MIIGTLLSAASPIAITAGPPPVADEDEHDRDQQDEGPLLACDREADEGAGGERTLLERGDDRPGAESGGEDLLGMAPVERAVDERIQKHDADDQDLRRPPCAAATRKPGEPHGDEAEDDQTGQRSPPVDAERAIAERDADGRERHTEIQRERPHRRLVREEAGEVSVGAGADRRTTVPRVVGEAPARGPPPRPRRAAARTSRTRPHSRLNGDEGATWAPSLAVQSGIRRLPLVGDAATRATRAGAIRAGPGHLTVRWHA